MEPVEATRLVEGEGVEGNADRGGQRQVTLLDADAWERATGEIGVSVAPSARRANLLLRGLDLAHQTDRVIRVGGCRIRIRGETKPCGRMDRAAPGLRDALAPEWRGGVHGMVIEGGPIAVGDAVAWE